MIKDISKFFLYYILILSLQVFVFGSIQFTPLFNIIIFPVFFLILPFETPGWLLLFIGFLGGLILDILLGTIAIHTFSAVLICFIRPLIIQIITPKGTDFESNPNINSQGFVWFLSYSGISLFIYLLCYFLLEFMNLDQFILLLTKLILSFILSQFFIFLFLYIVQSNKKRRFV